MSTPSPLLIWSCALIALALGLRSRAPVGRRRRHRIPLVLRAVAGVPQPGSATERARSPRLERACIAAGLSPDTAGVLARARVGGATAALTLGGLTALVHSAALLVGAAAAAVALIAPLTWAQRRARLRRASLVRDLPDLLDLVVICAESGMAIDPALRMAARHLDGPLPDEIGRTLHEIDLGTPRRAAYAGLATRVDAPQLTGLVGALLQAEELGAPIAATLARQGALIRSSRRQDIRDRGARAAPKVQLVVALVMVPAALLLVVGVLMIQLIGQIGGVAGGLT